MSNAQYSETLKRERSLSKYIPQQSHVTDDIIITKSGDFQKTYRVQGTAFETAGKSGVQIPKEALNMLLRGVGDSHVAIYKHEHHRRTSAVLPPFVHGWAGEFNDRYTQTLKDLDPFTTDLFLTVVLRPVVSGIARGIIRAGRRTTAQILKEREKNISKLNEICADVEATLSRNNLQPLGIYQRYDGVVMSSALSFLNLLLTMEWQEVAVTRSPIYEAIGGAHVNVGTSTIALTNEKGTKYLKAIELLDYSSETWPAMLADLQKEPYEYLITQSFCILDRADGMRTLKRQRGQLISSEDSGADAVDSLQEAIRALRRGDFCLGEYHCTFMVASDTVEKVGENAADFIALLKDKGFIPAVSRLATDACYFSQLPCAFDDRPRIAWLTSRNVASLIGFHTFLSGRASGLPWGDALAVFPTPSSTPFYFSFHAVQNDGKDYFNQRILANTIFVGVSGSGKSTLLNALYVFAARYSMDGDYAAVTIDIDRAAEGTILAMGGAYLAFQNGEPSGLNPFWLPDTAENVMFLETLVDMLAGGLSVVESLQVSKAVRTVMKFPKEKRSLSLLLQNMTNADATREDNLHVRLSKWCRNNGTGAPGSLWWVLDNEVDAIDLSTHQYYGFDVTPFLDLPVISGPIIHTLLHYINSMIDGRRFTLWIDEAFRSLDNPTICASLGKRLPTIRKANGFLVLATQSPETITNSSISMELREQVATRVFLPNSNAREIDYIEGMGLTPTEFLIVKQMPVDSRLFLVKQLGQSTVARLNLTGMDADLKIISTAGSFL